MNDETVYALNTINRQFYAACAADFDVTRAGAWKGWIMLLPYLNVPADAMRVLDVGCGNGRLGAFLIKRLPVPVVYHGIDFSEGLLDAAQRALEKYPSAQVTLEARDVIEQSQFSDLARFDLICAFGLLHHVPGAERRAALIQALADHVHPGGMLVWTEWRFHEYERFRERVIATPGDLDMEHGDFLLDWGGSAGMPPDVARRYCHHIDDAESERLIRVSGLELVTTYRADGHTRDCNRYVVLRRHENS